MRGGQDLIHRQKGLAGFGGFGLQNVERGSGDLAGFDGAAEGGDVDQFTAGAVDDSDAVLHFGEGFVVEHAHGFRGESDVQGDVVGLREELFAAH